MAGTGGHRVKHSHLILTLGQGEVPEYNVGDFHFVLLKNTTILKNTVIAMLLWLFSGISGILFMLLCLVHIPFTRAVISGVS